MRVMGVAAPWGRGGLRLAVLGVAVLGLALSGCGDSAPPPRSYPPLHYDYLTKLRLNVASITVEDHSVPASAADLAPLSPQAPALALGNMAEDRLVAAGPSGKAVFVIDDASLTREPGDAIDGRMTVHLDIITAGGVRAAFAEARVSRQRSGIGANEDQSGVLYDMTKQMMDDMNVEFEFQVRRTLREWLMSSSVVPAPVSQAPIAPSGATGGAAPNAGGITGATTGATTGGTLAVPLGNTAAPSMSPQPGVLVPPLGMRPAPQAF